MATYLNVEPGENFIRVPATSLRRYDRILYGMLWARIMEVPVVDGLLVHLRVEWTTTGGHSTLSVPARTTIRRRLR